MSNYTFDNVTKTFQVISSDGLRTSSLGLVPQDVLDNCSMLKIDASDYDNTFQDKKNLFPNNSNLILKDSLLSCNDVKEESVDGLPSYLLKPTNSAVVPDVFSLREFSARSTSLGGGSGSAGADTRTQNETFSDLTHPPKSAFSVSQDQLSYETNSMLCSVSLDRNVEELPFGSEVQDFCECLTNETFQSFEGTEKGVTEFMDEAERSFNCKTFSESSGKGDDHSLFPAPAAIDSDADGYRMSHISGYFVKNSSRLGSLETNLTYSEGDNRPNFGLGKIVSPVRKPIRLLSKSGESNLVDAKCDSCSSGDVTVVASGDSLSFSNSEVNNKATISVDTTPIVTTAEKPYNSIPFDEDVIKKLLSEASMSHNHKYYLDKLRLYFATNGNLTLESDSILEEKALANSKNQENLDFTFEQMISSFLKIENQNEKENVPKLTSTTNHKRRLSRKSFSGPRQSSPIKAASMSNNGKIMNILCDKKINNNVSVISPISSDSIVNFSIPECDKVRGNKITYVAPTHPEEELQLPPSTVQNLLQIFTANGDSRLDFGTIPEECNSKLEVFFINKSSQTQYVVVRLDNDAKHVGESLFSFDWIKSRHVSRSSPYSISCVVPVSRSKSVACRISVNCQAPILKQTPNVVQEFLGNIRVMRANAVEQECVSELGHLDCVVRVGRAHPRIDNLRRPIKLGTLPGSIVSHPMSIFNDGNISLKLSVTFSAQDLFLTWDKTMKLGDEPLKNIKIEPNNKIKVIVCRRKDGTSCLKGTEKCAMNLQIEPNGNRYEIPITLMAASNTSVVSSRKKNLMCFECNRTCLNWFNVPIGNTERNCVKLFNILSSPLRVVVMIRDDSNSSFSILDVNGTPIQVVLLTIPPKSTMKISVAFSPTVHYSHPSCHRASLIIKPQSDNGRLPFGKKATLSLRGTSGCPSLKMLPFGGGNQRELRLSPTNLQTRLSIINDGHAAAFIKIVCFFDFDCRLPVNSSDVVSIEPSPAFILEGGGQTAELVIRIKGGSFFPGTLFIVSGPELCRQALLSMPPPTLMPPQAVVTMGVDLYNGFTSTHSTDLTELDLRVCSLDLPQLYLKLQNQKFSLNMMDENHQLITTSSDNFNKSSFVSVSLFVEDTLSDSRINVTNLSPPQNVGVSANGYSNGVARTISMIPEECDESFLLQNNISSLT